MWNSGLYHVSSNILAPKAVMQMTIQKHLSKPLDIVLIPNENEIRFFYVSISTFYYIPSNAYITFWCAFR